MNTEIYISSGILDSYVLGLTTEQENAEVEALAIKYPAIKAEIEAIQSALEKHVLENEKNPPEYLKDKIWNKIQEEDNLSESSKKAFTKIEKGKTSSFSFLRIAASVLLVSSILGNLYLFNRWKTTKNALVAALTQNVSIAQVVKYTKKTNLTLNQQVEMLSDPSYKMIHLVGQKVAPESKILLAWNQNDKKVYLLKSALPVPPKGKQYQLWAIVDKKPVDLGVFDIIDSTVFMKNIANAQAFAVTLENMGGSPTPTSELYVMGSL